MRRPQRRTHHEAARRQRHARGGVDHRGLERGVRRRAAGAGRRAAWPAWSCPPPAAPTGAGGGRRPRPPRPRGGPAWPRTSARSGAGSGGGHGRSGGGSVGHGASPRRPSTSSVERADAPHRAPTDERASARSTVRRRPPCAHRVDQRHHARHPPHDRRARARRGTRSRRPPRRATAAAATSTPTAIGRSSPAPPLRTPLGARLTVTRCIGHVSPLDSSAARTRSRDSRQAASGRPTIVNPGRPLDTCTSTATGRPRRRAGWPTGWWRARRPPARTADVGGRPEPRDAPECNRQRSRGVRDSRTHRGACSSCWRTRAAADPCCGAAVLRQPRFSAANVAPCAPGAAEDADHRGREPRAVERDPAPPRRFDARSSAPADHNRCHRRQAPDWLTDGDANSHPARRAPRGFGAGPSWPAAGLGAIGPGGSAPR